jgi:hypothetical protein
MTAEKLKNGLRYSVLKIPKLSEQILLSIPDNIRTDFYEIQTTAVENLISVHVLPEKLLTHTKLKVTSLVSFWLEKNLS